MREVYWVTLTRTMDTPETKLLVNLDMTKKVGIIFSFFKYFSKMSQFLRYRDINNYLEYTFIYYITSFIELSNHNAHLHL